MSTGYHIYTNTGAGDAIDYGSPVATLSALSDLTWSSSALAYPGTWSFGVRAFNDLGDEDNIECAISIVLDASGNDITNQPMGPSGLRAFALASGAIRVEWTYPLTAGPTTPTGFRVYKGTGGAPDYSTPATITTPSYGTTPRTDVPYATGIAGTFVANIAGLTDGTAYTIGVRACNAAAQETNTNTVTATADATGPTAVDSLTAVAVATA